MCGVLEVVPLYTNGYKKMLNLPNVGETWIDTHSGVEGIVATVVGTTVTFVSLTGVRAAIGFNRSYSTWQLKRVPEVTQQCSRRGCISPAFLQYARPRKEGPEVVCPSHVPRGVHSQVITQRLPESFFEGQQCSGASGPTLLGGICPGESAIEVLGETYLPKTTLWTCPKCGVWWVHAIRDRMDVENDPHSKLKFIPEGYIFMGMSQHTDPMREAVHYRITVTPKASTRITGPKPLTLFDHLLMTDDE